MSLQVSLTQNKRAAGRYISKVRRALQKAMAEEGAKSGLSQADVARALGIDRSVVCRELGGEKDMTLGRVGELAWALGRRADFALLPHQAATVVPASLSETPDSQILVFVFKSSPEPTSTRSATDFQPRHMHA